ncbi:MAG: hypothetical protein IJA32_03265 [Lachnospiraceae bacterium]|nr:hypothetical protein [Lachnospiraceae bacterium]
MRRKMTVILMVLVFLLTGCQNQTSKEPKSIDEETALKTVFPESYHYTGEQVVINIEKIEPGEAYFINGTSTPMELDCIGIGRMFMPDDGTNEINMEQKCILSKEMLGDAYMEMFLWGENSFEYVSNKTLKYAASFGESKRGCNYNLPLFLEKKEFSFGSDKEALEEIIKFLEEAGIHLEENYKVYTCYLDYETLREQEAYYDMDGNKLDIGSKWEWSEADNAYLFYIHQAYCNLEDYKCGKKWKPKVEIYNAQIKVIYTSDGIAEMVVRDLSTYSMGSTKEQLLDFETIIQNIISHYEYILGNSLYEITSAQLICDVKTPNSDMPGEIIPVWEFEVTEKTEGGLEMHYEQRFNAITGEKMEH